MRSEVLAAMANDELMAECVEAAANPTHDPEGNQALVEEARWRGSNRALEPELVQMIEAALPPISVRKMILAKSTGSCSRSTGLLLALRAKVAARRHQYLFHGTLKSRLVNIAREGLIPARHPKSWGQKSYMEHAASGVFFTVNWRSAANWIGASTFVNGAIIRLPAAGLEVEEDRVATSPDCVVARGQAVDVTDAQVLLHPYTVTSSWVTLSKAIELGRQQRGATSTQKSTALLGKA